MSDRPAVTIFEGHDFGDWAALHRRGDRPSLLPYGLERLEAAGLRVRHSDFTHSDASPARLLRSRDGRLPYHLRFRGALGQVLVSLPQIARSAACVSIFEHHASIYQRMRSLRLGRLPPLVLVTCYLAQWLRDGSADLQSGARRVAHGARALTVFSRNQVEILRERAGVPPERVTVVPYGIDTSFYTPDGAPDGSPYVAVVGKDDGRDWPTFLAAARQTPGIPYRLATEPSMLAGLDVPDNVRLLGRVDHLRYRDLLRGAALVVVPTKDFAYPTGQSVLLEAMACGRPVVVTHTPAMDDYVTEAARTHAVGDAGGLAEAVASLWDDRAARERMGEAARRLASTRFDTRHMWDAVLPAILEVVAGGGAA
jgi:glycosyltransferase involved in cell wall biosynthesis